MCRKAILGILLAAFAFSCIHAQGSAPAKARRETSAATSPHHTHRTAASRNKHRAATAQTRTRRHASALRNSSSRESGRTAGLAIRRQLAQKRAARRTIALRRERLRPISRTEIERPTHAQKETHEDAPTEDASASMLLLPGIAETNPTVRLEPATPARNANAEEASLQVRRGAMPPPLRGSLESLERQNERLDADGLERIEDEADLADRIEHHLLVPLPASDALTVNAELPDQHRYCRPWTARFLSDLARAHEAAFHRPFEVSSAVRTIEYQKRLMHINGNAAAAEGDIVSPHLTGATIDIAKDGMSRAEIAWMRRRLLAIEMAGNIDVEEEFQQSCFHITVYKSYAPPSATRPASQARSGSAAGKRHKAAAAADTQGL